MNGDPAAWKRDAACRGCDPDLFYPHRGQDVRAAKALCRGCPVRFECLEASLDGEGERFGIWGGLSEKERRRIRRMRRKAAGIPLRGPIARARTAS